MRRRRAQRGFTLFELCLTVLILGIIGTVVVPTISGTTGAPGLRTAANMLACDVEYVESACISTPQSLRVLRLDLSNNRYWVAMAASPETVVASPVDGQPFLNDFATGRSGRLSGVRIASVTGVNPNAGSSTSFTIAFDAYGRPTGSSGNNIVITVTGTSGATLSVTIDGATGEVSITG